MKSENEFIQYHLNRINVIQASLGNKKLFVQCFTTDEGARVFPNSNFAVKEIFVNDTKWDENQPSQESDRDNKQEGLKEAAEKLLHLHLCEQEGLLSGKPTPKQWIEAVNKLSDALNSKQEVK